MFREKERVILLRSLGFEERAEEKTNKGCIDRRLRLIAISIIPLS